MSELNGLIGLQPEKKKNKLKNTLIVLPTGHLTEPDLGENSVMAEQQKSKKKKRRTEQHPHPSEPAATPVSLEEMEGPKQKKRRVEKVSDSQVAEVEKKKKKKRSTEPVPDSLVTAEKKKKKKKTVQLPGLPVPVEAEGSPVEKKKKKKKLVGAAETVSQIQNGENVVTERRKKKNREPEGSTGIADERMSEITTAMEESQLVTGETETQDDIPGDLREEDCIEQLMEFIPNIRSKSPHQINQLIRYDLERFKAFKSQGIPLRSGRFTALENERLDRNVSDFLELTGLNSAMQLFHPRRFKDKQQQIKQLCKLHKFHDKIAEGIPRSWHVVYERGRKMFNEDNYKGSFTEDELHQLQRFQTLHGNSWTKISALMDRSSPALEKRFTQMTSKTGPWIDEENDRLMDAMKEYLREQTEPGAGDQTDTGVVRKEKLYKDIPWNEISFKVQTRSWTQCRAKWLCFLKRKMTSPAMFSRGRKGDRTRMHLIEKLYAMRIEDPAEIDWEQVSESIGDVTPYYVQRQFFRMKVTKVPLWQRKSHCDVIDFLYQNVRPELEENLRAASKRRGESAAEPTELFLLSNIFSETFEVNNVNDDLLMIDDDDYFT